MSTPTPETDGQYKEYARRDNNAKCVSIDFARKLERERNELKQQLSIASTAFTEQLHRVNFVTNAQVNEIALDRDAWKAKAERKCKWNIVMSAETECGKRNIPPWLYNPEFGYVMCPFCGGRIVKEEK